MADYRRLISYIYEYEGKQKGKNVGFAKLEARNGQCRINVNVKRIYMGGNAIGAYLLGTGGRETFIGNVFVRGGNGEFRANVDSKNVEGTGTGLDTYFGLSVHDVKNSWRCYKTIWEDALAAEEGNTAENPVLSVPKFTAEMLPEAEKEMTPQAVSKVVKEIEDEIAKEEERREQEEKTAHAAELREEAGETEENPSMQNESTVSDGEQQKENSEDHGMVYLTEESEEIDETVKKAENSPQDGENIACGNTENQTIDQETQKSSETEPDNNHVETIEQQQEPLRDPMQPMQNSMQAPVNGQQAKKHNESHAQQTQMPWAARPPFLMRPPQRSQRPVMQPQQNTMQQPVMSQPDMSSASQKQPVDLSSAAARSSQPQPRQPVRPAANAAPMVSPELENPEVLRYLQETEDLAADPEKLWEEFKKTYPKIQPFEYEDGCDILTIRPQDIGKLPRECWIHGNNSFLLHGYYNFRYLILVKLGGNKKKARYLLGVPGHYYSSEKYMATMFGFPNFVLSRRQPVGDGRFGYWYTDLKIR